MQHPADHDIRELIAVHDGDTITVLAETRRPVPLSVRLIDIDAPETYEAGHHEARETLAALIRNLPLHLEAPHPVRGPTDGFNRTLAYLWTARTLIQREIIASGWAVLWTPYGPHQHDLTLRLAQHDAQQAKLGIWQWPSHRLYDVYHRPRQPHRRPRPRATRRNQTTVEPHPTAAVGPMLPSGGSAAVPHRKIT